MTITACVENKMTNSLPQNLSLVALLIKDEGDLANHPLSCHPQGVFGRQESVRKGEKMREKKKSGKTESFHAKSLLRRKLSLYRFLIEAYILLRTREITKMYEVPKIHRPLGKSHKKLVKVGSNWTQEQVANLQPVNFRRLRNFATL